MDYKETVNYWDEVFNKIKARQLVSEKSGHEQIDLALDWISESTCHILDFGCGSGAMLAFLAKRKEANYYGIDPSEKAIALAHKLFDVNQLEKGLFYVGSTDKLKSFNENHFDAVILSNVLDNMKPFDALEVLNIIQRILKKEGKLLIKLNPYLSKEKVEENKLKHLEEDFYLEPSGLYLWNKSTSFWRDILKKNYKTIKESIVLFKEHNHTNRLFLCKKK